VIRWLLLLLCASTAFADTAIEAPPIPGQVRSASVHDAARLLSEVYHINILVAGPNPSVDIDFGADWRVSIAALAKAAGLTHRRWGTLELLVPDERVHDVLPPPRGLGKDRLIDLDFAHIKLAQVVALCGDILQRKITGAPDGDLSIRARNLSTGSLLAFLQVLAKSKPGVNRFAEGATFPSSGFVEDEPECPQSSGDVTPYRRPVRFFCTPPAELRLLGVAREVALVAGPKGRAWLIRRGDLVSTESARVVEIGNGQLRLENGIVLHLPEKR
jgi:hypothetical protein